MRKRTTKVISLLCVTALSAVMVVGCGTKAETEPVAEETAQVTEETVSEAETAEETVSEEAVAVSNEDIIVAAASAGAVGNWGLGNEYEVQALLSKYGQDTAYLSQAFDMDGFDDDSITLASAMTYNELGLVKNDYDGGYAYGDAVGTIDMNEEGVAMLEDNIFTTKTFAKENAPTRKPNTGLLTQYINNSVYDLAKSFVIGDRITDVKLAQNLGAKGIFLANDEALGANEISKNVNQIADDILSDVNKKKF